MRVQPDGEVILEAIVKAQSLLAENLHPEGTPDAKTIDELFGVLDDLKVVMAVRRETMRRKVIQPVHHRRSVPDRIALALMD